MYTYMRRRIQTKAVFVIVGLGSDLVFVLNDGWTQSSAAVEVIILTIVLTDEYIYIYTHTY